MKIDLKRDRPDLYRPSRHDFSRVVVPRMRFLAVDGHGDPNTSSDYAEALAVLYPVAYAVKFAFRARTGDDVVVGPLEGLWSSADPSSFADRRKGEWDWTIMIPLPAPVTDADHDDALRAVARKKPGLPLDRLRILALEEGLSLQILHIGSYDDEAPVLARLHEEVMPAQGLTWNGRHHEIYLSDPRRVAPEKLRTVLRQPVRPAPASG